MDNSIPVLFGEGCEPVAMRDNIVKLEAAILEAPQLDIPLAHRFLPGIYVREAECIPAGTIFTSRIHKSEHLCFIVSGELTLATEAGSERIVGPCFIHAMPGTKRAAVTHTDVHWINVHPNPENETDITKVEDMLACDDFEDPALLAILERVRALA